MMFETALKKSSALLAAMLIMAAAWSLLHLPGANLQMVTFAFLSATALCNVPDFNTRLNCCLQMVAASAAAQFVIGITANYPAARILIDLLITFFILIAIPEKQNAIIVLLVANLALFAPPGFSASLNRSMDIAVAGMVVLLVTTLNNFLVPPSPQTANQTNSFSLREAAIISAEVTTGFIIAQLFDHEQFYWIMLTILFIHLSATPKNPLPRLVKKRIAATPLGIFLGGFYLACFNTTGDRMIYIIPITGTLGFFMLYLKNDYFIFSLLFMFSLTLFSDWMLGTYQRYHFTELLVIRTLATVTGGILLLCGKKLMQKETVS